MQLQHRTKNVITNFWEMYAYICWQNLPHDVSSWALDWCTLGRVTTELPETPPDPKSILPAAHTVWLGPGDDKQTQEKEVSYCQLLWFLYKAVQCLRQRKCAGERHLDTLPIYISLPETPGWVASCGWWWDRPRRVAFSGFPDSHTWTSTWLLNNKQPERMTRNWLESSQVLLQNCLKGSTMLVWGYKKANVNYRQRQQSIR